MQRYNEKLTTLGAILASVTLLALVLGASSAVWAQSDTGDDFRVGTFNTQGRVVDEELHMVNPTTPSSGILCAMIYVFDNNEELQECCGCPVTSNGLRRLSVINDLTANPNTGASLPDGVLKIVSADSNKSSSSGVPQCDPGLAYNPDITLREWITHSESIGKVAGTTEAELQDTPLGGTCDPTATNGGECGQLLIDNCSIIEGNSSTHGVCSCGLGDSAAHTLKAHGRH